MGSVKRGGSSFEPDPALLPLDERLERFRNALEALCLGHRIWIEDTSLGGLTLIVDPPTSRKTGLQTTVRMLRANTEE